MTILNKEKILEAARAFIDEGKFDKAIREYEKILLADPQDLKVKLRVAELYTKRKQINEAIRIYREVAEGYTAEGFLLKAVTVFKNILRLNPSLIEVNEELAQLYERMGLVSDAVRQYDILASTLDMKGLGERVVEVRKKIVGLNPKDGSSRIRLAELLQREGDTDGAIDQYEQYAARVEKESADKTKLADLYEKILAHRPGKLELVRKLIDIYEVLGEHKKALRWLESAKDLVENDVGLLRLAAMIYSSQNQHETARMKYMLIADLEAKAGNADAALDAYCEILVMLPDEEDRLFKRVEELKPGSMEDLLARAMARRKEIEEEEIRRQVEEQATEAKKGEMQEGADRKAEVLPEVRREEKAAPAKPPEPLEKKAVQEVKPEPLIPLPVEPVRTPAPDRGKADAAYGLGVTYRKMGLRQEAERELRKALAIYGDWLEAGNEETSVIERVKSIEAQLAGGTMEAKPSSGQKTQQREETKPVEKGVLEKPGQTATKPSAPAQPKSEDEKPKGDKKKRISYV